MLAEFYIRSKKSRKSHSVKQAALTEA